MRKLRAALLILGICFGVAPAFSQNGVVTFENLTKGQLRVEILHSDGSFQKGEYIGVQKSHSFKFASSARCRDKSRRYRVYRAADGVRKGDPISSGDFDFKAKEGDTRGDLSCTLTLKRLSANHENLNFYPVWDESDVGKKRTTVTLKQR